LALLCTTLSKLLVTPETASPAISHPSVGYFYERVVAAENGFGKLLGRFSAAASGAAEF